MSKSIAATQNRIHAEAIFVFLTQAETTKLLPLEGQRVSLLPSSSEILLDPKQALFDWSCGG